MRSTAWIGSGAALGISLAAGLTGLVTLGGAGDATADGLMNRGGSGYRGGPAITGYRSAARPAPRVKGYSYRRPVRRYYRPVAPKTCKEFHYWSAAKGRCLDARTSPPDID